MASATMKWFGKSTLAMLNKEHDWLDDVYKFMLTTATFTPDQDVHDYKDDVTNEVTNAAGSAYVAAGQTAANKTIGYTAGTNVTKLDCDDPTWATASINGVKNIILYNSSPGSDATRPLLAFGIIDNAVSPDAGTLTIQIDTAGIITTTAAA